VRNFGVLISRFKAHTCVEAKEVTNAVSLWACRKKGRENGCGQARKERYTVEIQAWWKEPGE